MQSPSPSEACVTLSKAPLALKSGGAVSSNNHPCPRTLKSREGDERAPSHLPVCIQDGYTARDFGTERQAGFQRALLAPSPAAWPWKGTCAGWSGCGWRQTCSRMTQKPSPGGRHSFSPPTSKWSCLPPRSGGACHRHSSNPSPGLMSECRTLNVYRFRLLRHL